MNLFDQVSEDLKATMKAQDKFKLSVIKMLKSALQLEKISKMSDLDDSEVIRVIKKQIKIRNDSMNDFIKYNRQDLADNLAKEIEILKVYLPEEMPKEEIEKEIDKYLEDKELSMKNFGVFMKELSAIFDGRADNGLISGILKNKITG